MPFYCGPKKCWEAPLGTQPVSRGFLFYEGLVGWERERTVRRTEKIPTNEIKCNKQQLDQTAGSEEMRGKNASKPAITGGRGRG